MRAIPGVELKEKPRNKENAWCSGGGHEIKVSSNDFAVWTGSERLEEADSVEASNIVTCCPFAKTNLLDASDQRKNKKQVFDLVEIVADSLE